MPRSSLTITTIQRGERVTVRLTGRVLDRVSAYSGRVVASDARAVRLAEAWSRFGLGWNVCAEEKVIP